MRRLVSFLFCLLYLAHCATAQQETELNSGWKCVRATDINKSGEDISTPLTDLTGWLPARVPGTVLTTLLNNKLFPDPFFGMNNKHIPDIYTTGTAYYTFWFVKDFNEVPPAQGEEIMLQFRGINYSYDVFLNGHKINDTRVTALPAI
jgi:beta-galactosidase/beta-glucuronidase